jgi:hypothetical protein
VFTKLTHTLKLACASDVKAGQGYDILTDSFTGTYPVVDRQVTTSKGSRASTFNGEAVVIEQHVDLLNEDEIGLSVGARVTEQASLEAKFQILHSRGSKASSIFVKYTRSGNFEWEELDKMPPNFVADTKSTAFSNEHGDYYVSGIQRKYGFWAIIICQ